MRRLAASNHFQKQLKKLPPEDREKALQALKRLLESLEAGEMPAGLGFKKLNGDKYEIRVGLRNRIIMKAEKDTLVCHLIGDHEAVRRHLRNYRNK